MKPSQSIKQVETNPDFVRLSNADGLLLDLRYASERNFLGENVYGDFNRAYLHRIAAAKLLAAVRALSVSRPELRLLVFDALRPRSAQQILWNHVEGTGGENYVSRPSRGSVHCYGFAVDLTLAESATGHELDMGTEFDYFAPLSEPRFEERFLAEGKLLPAAVENRRLLRRVMEGAGFSQLESEWWHFDALPAREVRAGFQIVE